MPLLRSFGALSVGEAMARVISLVAVVVAARVLDPGGFGVVILGVTLVNWFRLVVDGGTELLTMRDVSREPERFREIAEPVLALRLALSLVACGLFVGIAMLLAPSPSDRLTLALFALSLPPIALNPRWMVIGLQSSKAVAVGNIGSQAVLAVGVLALVNDAHDGEVVALLSALGELVYCACVIHAVARRVGLPHPRVRLESWRSTLRASSPLLLNQAARAVMYSADLMIIAVVLTSSDLGLYGAAYRPVLFVSGIIGLFAASFLASYSASAQSRDLFRRATLAAVAISVPLAVVMSVTADPFVTLVFGDGYTRAAIPLAILAWSLPLLALSVPYSSALIAAERQITLMWHSVAGAALNIVANVVLIPSYGINAASATTVASFLVVLLLNHRSAVRSGLAPEPGVILARIPRPAGGVNR